MREGAYIYNSGRMYIHGEKETKKKTEGYDDERRGVARWAARESERRVTRGRGMKKESGTEEEKRYRGRIYSGERKREREEGWRPKMIGILGE